MLVFLLKSLPLGCYFNIYGFGSHDDSFYQQSVEYIQQTMSDYLEHIKKLDADLGGTEILPPLKDIYNQPCQEGHPRQLFVFTSGEVDNTDKVIFEVGRHSNSHRCFSFGIGEGASTALIKGIAHASGGSAEYHRQGADAHQEPQLAEYVKVGNALLGTNVSPQTFGL